MNTIRFAGKESFIAALEGRRKFWRDYDRRRAREHKEAEQKFLADARAKLRTASKWSYAALQEHLRNSYGDFRLGEIPSCPALTEPKIDKVLAALNLTEGRTFTVDTAGTWSDAHYLLTADPDAKTKVC